MGEVRAGFRPAWAETDVGAVRHNARWLKARAGPAALCAVVKADGYGHGAPAVARAAIEGGARWLAVATVEEGIELRDAALDAPVLILSEPPAEAMDEVAGRSLVPTLYSLKGVAAFERAAARRGVTLDAHVKVDTGMHRVGAAPEDLLGVVSAVASSPHVRYAALWTHLAVADGKRDEDREFTREQLRRFTVLRSEIAEQVRDAGIAHAANSAATIWFPEARLDMVRCGIALYGSPPVRDGGLDCDGLRTVMSLKARVTHVRELDAGERPSYGRRRELPERSLVATVPLGYADGVPRRYFDEGGTVLIRGRRRTLAGTVTMDQIVVDCGPHSGVCTGDEVVLIGHQGDERITAWDWAEALGTISYEVLSRIGPRVRRVVVDSGERGGQQ